MPSTPVRTLGEAFLDTCYRIYLPTATADVRIGSKAQAVDDWVRAHAAASAAIITACNPRSRQLTRSANRRRQCALLHLLHGMNHPMLPGRNIAVAGDWPEEPSLVIAALSRGAARRLAARYKQHACVWLALGRPAELVWVRD